MNLQKRILLMMQDQDMSFDDAQEADTFLTDLADFNARMREIQPFLDGTMGMPIGLKKCLILARKHIGVSIAITIDVIDMWLQNDKDSEVTGQQLLRTIAKQKS